MIAVTTDVNPFRFYVIRFIVQLDEEIMKKISSIYAKIISLFLRVSFRSNNYMITSISHKNLLLARLEFISRTLISERNKTDSFVTGYH